MNFEIEFLKKIHLYIYQDVSQCYIGSGYLMTQIGNIAPDFTAFTTQGALSLSEFDGKWVILFAHPADFTPVCTTEFIAFSRMYDKFKNLNTELLGISVDSIYSHIAWLRDIEEKLEIKIPFPLIADPDKEICKMYNLLDEKTGVALRGIFIIDPDGKIRFSAVYPFEMGRKIDEILRCLRALQISDETGYSTPANWEPGDPTIDSPPKDMKGAEERVREGADRWYLMRR